MASLHYPPTLRFRVIARTPTVFIDYLFEILLAVVAVLTGLGYLTGFVSGASVIRLLPPAVAFIHAGILILGASTVVVGFKLKRYGTVVANGLKLLCAACLAYAVAVVFFAGIRAGLVPFLMALAFATLAAWRAFILRSTYLLFAARGPANEATRET